MRTGFGSTDKTTQRTAGARAGKAFAVCQQCLNKAQRCPLRGTRASSGSAERLCKGTKRGGLFTLNFSGGAARVAMSQQSVERWHRRLGHLNVQTLRKAVSKVLGVVHSDVCVPWKLRRLAERGISSISWKIGAGSA